MSIFRLIRSSRFQVNLFSLLLLASVLLGAINTWGAGTTANVHEQRFNRTTGAPNLYTVSFDLPDGVSGPYQLIVENGDANGSNRVSSGWITINNTQVAGSSQFNQNVSTFTASVSLLAHNTMTVKLASRPGSYLTITISGNITDIPPLQVLPSVTPAPNEAGWNNSNVTVSYTCSGGVAPVSCPPSQTITTEGAGQVITANAKDASGRTATADATLNIDKSVPIIMASATTVSAPYVSGQWTNQAVTVRFTCTDSISGVNTVTPALTVEANGGDQTATGNCADNAGNTASATLTGINIDTSTPIIVATATTADGKPYTAGQWTSESVTVSFSCNDSVSGVKTVTPPATMSSDGVNQSVNGSCTDNAGNTAAASFTGINIDSSKPALTATAITADGKPYTAGQWTNQSVTVSFACTGSLSGGASVIPSDPVTVSGEGAEQSVSATCTGRTGTTSSISFGPINIDKSAPTLTVSATTADGRLYQGGQWTRQAVTASFSCTDAVSGVMTVAPATTISGDGANPPVTGTCTDNAGNTASASTSGINIDSVSPTLTASATTADGKPYAAGQWTNQPVIVTFNCADSASGVNAVTPSATMSTAGTNQAVSGTCADNAGNTATTSFTGINIATALPTLTAGAMTADGKPYVAGKWTNQAVTVLFSCSENTGSSTISPAQSVTVSAEGKHPAITGTCTDAAGNLSAPASFGPIYIDMTPPKVVATATPTANSAGWNNSDVTVSFSCSDNLSGVANCPTANVVTTEGANQIISGIAVDEAGNSSGPESVTVSLDKTPPTITASLSPAPNGAGWNTSDTTVSFSCTDGLSGVTSCPQPATVSRESANQAFSATVTDLAGNIASTSINVSLDKTPPTILGFTVRDHISRLNLGQASVAVQDNVGVAQVVLSLNGATLGAFSSPPYEVNLTVPDDAKPGDTLTLIARATDQAGNVATSSREIILDADGVVVGQVLSDATGLPIKGATALISGNGGTDTTDEHGKYSVQATNTHEFVSFSADPGKYTTVEREVYVQQGVGTVPVDARLTPLNAATQIGSAGGTVTSGNVSVSVTAGAMSDGNSLQLTSLSGQGLPGLLPLGWSPLAAFDLRGNAPSSLAVTVNKLRDGTAHLAAYNVGVHAWTMVIPNIPISSGTVTITVPGAGAYALVVPDHVDPPIAIVAAGQSLAALQAESLPASAASTGSVNPAIMPPGGGTATATLQVQVPDPVPSGTVIQAKVSENFSLKSGQKISEDDRLQDILLYNVSNSASGPTMTAQFPVTPSHHFALTDLASGAVHLDILAGREAVRGHAGGSTPVIVNNENITLSLPGGSLSQNTAVNVEEADLDPALPQTSSIAALKEVEVDFSGEVLNTSAQLAIPADGLNPDDNYAVAYIERINGVSYLRLVALAQVTGTQLVSKPFASNLVSLPGIVQEGEYVFYRLGFPIGFISGKTTSLAGPISAVVATDSLPFVDISRAGGQYLIPAISGSVSLTATVSNTALSGSAVAQALVGQTVTADIALSGAATAATVSPADGSTAVSQSTQITVTATQPLNPQSISVSNISLLEATPQGNKAVSFRSILSPEGTTLAIIPTSNLDAGSKFTLQIAGLLDVYSQAVVVPVVSFTTKSGSSNTYDPSQIVFSFPDENGNVMVTAPAGALQPGTRVLIVNFGNGITVSFTAGNDGALSGKFPATLDDQLQVTVTDPNGGTRTFTRTQFVAPNGSVAVGSGGGTVTGPGGVQMIIPAGAVSKGTVFQIQALGADAFPQLPDWPGMNFGSGMQISSPSMPTFQKEVKLAFPVPPNAPPGAFYYVYRQITDQDGNVYYDTIDHAFVQGQGDQARVVTASPPFCGYMNSYGNFQKAAGNSFQPVQTAVTKTFLMYDGMPFAGPDPSWDPNQAGVASQGLIIGKALLTIAPKEGETEPTYQPAEGATIQLTSKPSVAVSSSNCSTFALLDPQMGGGQRSVTATYAGQTLVATVDEVDGIQPNDADYDITAGLERQYRNIGRVNFIFKPLQPIVPPTIDIELYTLDGNNMRVPTNGIVQTGAPLVIAIKTKLAVAGATVDGASYSTGIDVPENPADPLVLDYRVTGYYPSAVPGTRTITVTALPATGDSKTAITAKKSFLVVAGLGEPVTTRPGEPPHIVSNMPQDNGQDVVATIAPSVTFSEPVTNLPGNVSLNGSDDNPGVHLTGVRADGSIADPVSSTDAIVSLTIQPVRGLKFNHRYTLAFSGAIQDQNEPPLALEPYSLTFTTEKPKSLGTTSDNSSTRTAVLGKYAYTGVVMNVVNGGIDVIDLTDSYHPVDLGIQLQFVGHPVDVAVAPSFFYTAPDGSTRTIPVLAVATTAGAYADGLPSNIWLYDLSSPTAPKRIAGFSATNSANQAGSLLRIVFKGQKLYASTFPVGLQVIDVPQAIEEYQKTDPTRWAESMSTEGDGFALDAVQTIPVNVYGDEKVPLVTAPIFDLSVGDFMTQTTQPSEEGATRSLIVATGRLPLVVADPVLGSGGVLYPQVDAKGALDKSPLTFTDPNSNQQYVLQQGVRIALGAVPAANGETTEQFAVLAGTDSASGPVLFVVDMDDPVHPKTVGALELSSTATDIVITGRFALIGTKDSKILVVNLQDPTQPILAGEIDGGYSYYVALTSDGIVVGSSAGLPSSGGLPQGGIQTASLDTLIGLDYCRCGHGGLPIDFTNGNVSVSHQDYQIPGLGGGISLHRTWNSLWSRSNPIEIAGIFGDSWRSNFEERLQKTLDKTGSVTGFLYWRPSGEHWTFTLNPTTQTYSVSSPADQHATVAQDSTGSQYVLTFSDGTKETFRSDGYPVSMADRNGNQTTIGYDSANRIASVTDPAGRVLNFDYPDAQARQVQSISDSVGTVATYAYTQLCPIKRPCSSLLKKVTYAGGSSINFGYSGSLITSVTDGDGIVLEAHNYDEQGRGLTSSRANGVEKITVAYIANGTSVVTNSAGAQTRYNYYKVGGNTQLSSVSGPGCSSCEVASSTSYQRDARGYPTAITDANGNTTEYTYDGSGNVLTSTTQLDAKTKLTWQYTYNGFGEVLTATDPLGNVTTNTYDAKGNLLSTTTPSPDGKQPASKTQFGYDAKGQLTSITDPLNHTTTIAYTPAGLVQSITDAQNHSTTYGYDARGNRTSATDAAQNVTSFTYDQMNRLTAVEYPDKSTAAFTYDSRGRRKTATDGNSKTTTYAYDDADRLVSVADAANNVTNYGYDAEGNLVSITDAAQHTTSFTYDSQNRVTKTTFPSKLTESYTYDGLGNLVSKTDRKNQTISYTYDTLNRLVSKSTGVQYTYDVLSRLTQVTDSTGTYGFGYDSLGRLTGTTTKYTFLSGQTFTNSYTYDTASNRTSFKAPDGGTTTYVYDALNRLTDLTNSWSGHFGFNYDQLSRRTQMTRPNAIPTGYNYDNLSRLMSVLHGTGPTPPDGATYGYDNAGNRTSKQNVQTGVHEDYTYDAIYQLKQVTQSVNDAANTSEQYTYDAVGNRLSALGSAPWTVNVSNQLLSTPSSNFTYDNNGNLVSKTEAGTTTEYTWDIENRLTRVTKADGTMVSFQYDPFGRRIEKSSPSGTVNYVYDGANIVGEYDASGTLTAKYTQGAGIDEPLAINRGGVTGFYNADGLGSITSITGADGSKLNSYVYDSFGNTSANETIANSFRYTGREWDSETGLYYYRARYYDPQIGRFISEDPLGFVGGDNYYGYVDNDPADFADPAGLKKRKKKCAPKKPCSAIANFPKDARRRTMIATLLGEGDGEGMVGKNQFADDESGLLSDVGDPGGAEITDATLDLQAKLLAETMLNLGHLGNSGTYTGLPRGRQLVTKALTSAQGSLLCTMLLRAIGAVDFALQDKNRVRYNQWKAVVQQNSKKQWFVRSRGDALRVGGDDIYYDPSVK